MKYVTATLGALLNLGGAFLALMILPVLIFPQIHKSVAGIVAVYIIAVLLGITAAVLSFRATLRHYAPKAAAVSERIRCPGCGEEVLATAERCPLCGQEFSSKE